MDAGKTSRLLFRNHKNDLVVTKDDKFKFISCSVDGIYCRDILPEINKLYAQAELARINREYQKSTDLLQIAYLKTLLLKESTCATCVDFFQTSIASTLEEMQEEVYDMSVGFLRKKRYEIVYERMRCFMQKMKLFKIDGTNIFLTNNAAPAGTDF